MFDSWNYAPDHDKRSKRYDELEQKSCLRADARYVVIRGADAYDGLGEICSFFNSDRQTFFTNLRTARAFAQIASYMHDCPFGIFRYEFIQGVDFR